MRLYSTTIGTIANSECRQRVVLGVMFLFLIWCARAFHAQLGFRPMGVSRKNHVILVHLPKLFLHDAPTDAAHATQTRNTNTQDTHTTLKEH